MRKELEEESIDFMNYLANNNLLFDDSYLESYLYALIYKIYPTTLNDGRPGFLNIKILKKNIPYALIFPNGSLYITTGLLSTINSEEELIGVLSHEIAHFVLDHSVININKAEKRQKRAEFWAGVATGVAVAADAYVASNNEYYVPGAITLSTAVLAYEIAGAITERMGIKYSRDQELEADKSAAELMNFIQVDPGALASALSKIKTYSILNGNYIALTGQGTHPAIDDRIKQIGTPQDYADVEYDKKISFVNSFNAQIEYNNKHFNSCINLVNRNIESNVATEEDYVLLAIVTLNMHDTDAKNQEALTLIQKAKSLNVYPTINISKQEAIVLIRLNRLDEAKQSLVKYEEELKDQKKYLEEIKDERQWSATNRFIESEYEWTSKMIYKVNNF